MLLFLTSGLTASANIQDSLVPREEDKTSVGEVQLDYNEYPQHHYYLDSYIDTSGDWMPWNWAEGAGKQIFIALAELTNSIWQLNVLLAHFTGFIVQEAFTLDFVSSVTNVIGKAIQGVAGFSNGFHSDGLWPLLVTFMLCLVGTWAAYVGIVKRETSRAWGGLISSLIVFVFSLGFFANAGTILKELNDWSSNIQSNILNVSASIVNPGSSYDQDEGIASIRNQMFDLMVKKPYTILQYGSTEIEQERVNELLSVDPLRDGESREEIAKIEVEDRDNAMMGLGGVSQRAAFIPLLFIANTIIGVFSLIVSGSIILYQLVFLALALFAPVPLLMAVVPRWQQSAVVWFSKLVHAQLMKIAIALLLTILFGISSILYQATSNGDIGYLGMMLLQIVCFVGIWSKRKDLFGSVTQTVSNIQSSTGETLRNYQNKYRQAKNLFNNANRHLHRGGKSNAPLADRHGDNSAATGKGKDSQTRNKKGLKGATAGAAAAAGLVDREQLERDEYKKQLHSRPNVENAPTTDKDKLLNRSELQEAKTLNSEVQGDKEQEVADRSELHADKERTLLKDKDQTLSDRTQDKDSNNVTHIDDLRKKRLEKGKLSEAPLADRKKLHDASSETASAIEKADMKDANLENRSDSSRNVNLLNKQEHKDKVNEKQDNKIFERKTLEKGTEKDISSDNVNREKTQVNTNERNDTVDQKNVNKLNKISERETLQNGTERDVSQKTSNSVTDRNVKENISQTTRNNETINRQNIQNNSNERNVTETVNQTTRNNETINRQNIQNNNNERNVTETVNQTTRNNETINREKVQNNTVEHSTKETVNNITERSRNNVTDNVTKNVSEHTQRNVNVNREKVSADRIIENVKNSGKHLTKWEASQLAKANEKPEKKTKPKRKGWLRRG
ncbi:Membrane protein, putative (plasmid) [Shouchella clausii]|nr:Membrane protein, putative [Shouchella clausii]